MRRNPLYLNLWLGSGAGITLLEGGFLVLITRKHLTSPSLGHGLPRWCDLHYIPFPYTTLMLQHPKKEQLEGHVQNLKVKSVNCPGSSLRHVLQQWFSLATDCCTAHWHLRCRKEYVLGKFSSSTNAACGLTAEWWETKSRIIHVSEG